MDIIVNGPPSGERIYQADIYRLKSGGYELVIGKMGQEVPIIPNLAEIAAASEFLDLEGIHNWVSGEVVRLAGEGKEVNFNGLRNVPFLTDLVLRQFYEESPASTADEIKVTKKL